MTAPHVSILPRSVGDGEEESKGSSWKTDGRRTEREREVKEVYGGMSVGGVRENV